jgi:hypothetical protein
MKYPISTGEAAQLLGTTEPRLAETVRRGKVNPAPPIMAGRRLWGPQHLRQAARHLDLLSEEFEERLGGEVGSGT